MKVFINEHDSYFSYIGLINVERDTMCVFMHKLVMGDS